ncbi:Grayanic acid biosynthesis cluster O-methyltransferase [Paramyrothecium foliicola]|nr:Grayanic acid biosynthesis cluster O-methyltransferase [Paramyrothecium foliicola]
MSVSRISDLSSRIAHNTAKLDDYLAASDHPTPSFDVDAHLGDPIPQDGPGIDATRSAIIDDAIELQRLVLGPRDYLLTCMHNAQLAQQAIVRFRLAHTFPIDGEATFAEIAKASQLDEPFVRQVLRLAINQHIFCEPQAGRVQHNAVSRLLVEDDALHDWVGASTDELWQAAAQTCNAISKWPGSQKPNETGFALANLSDKSPYEILNDYPERARRFANAMKSFTQGTGFELHHITDTFPWGELGEGTVVDVGGSQGFVCFALAKKFPSLSFVVQDLEPVIDGARTLAQSNTAESSARVEFMVHDFLTEQPVHGAVAFIMRWVLHNWSDEYCINILKNLIPALTPGAKIIVNDTVLPPIGTMPRWREARLRATDLTMKEMQNSHERELEDWKKLFSMADSRFKFQDARQPAGSNLWIMVIEWQGGAS